VQGAAPGAADDEHAVRGRHLDVRGIDTGELDDDREGRWIVDAVDVHGRPKAPSGRDESRDLAEVREELFHLVLQTIDVLSRAHDTIVPMGRMLKIAGAAAGFLLYVWFAAVKSVDRVNERKRSRRGV